jgi:hypothetical protein
VKPPAPAPHFKPECVGVGPPVRRNSGKAVVTPIGAGVRTVREGTPLAPQP